MKIEQINSPLAPKALGNYSHAVVYGDLIFVSGMAARDPKTNQVPGLELDSSGRKIKYDIRQETRGTLENIKRILESAGSSLAHILEVNVYLTDMNDFAEYNEVYSTYFVNNQPARTTVGVAALPGNISIEMRVVAVKL